LNEKPPTLGRAVVRVLLTGFEPFGGSDVNVSMDVVNALTDSLVLEDPWSTVRTSSKPISVELERLVLSVDSAGSMVVANRIASGETWDAVLHLGVCGSCTVPRLETLAADRLAMRIPDNAGRKVDSSTLSGEGDLQSTVYVKHWFQSWQTDVEISTDAGAYLCNETLYRSLEANLGGTIPVLFLHLPRASVYPMESSLELVIQVIARMIHKPVITVAGSLLLDERKFLVARRAGHERHPGTWEFPGGKLESGETYQSAIVREMEEELGWLVRAGSSLGTWHHELPEFTIALDVLMCEFEGESPSYIHTERWTSHDRVEWHTYKSSKDLDFTGSDHEVVERLKELDLID
jgi:8-oxo-dGTP diphosphatase